MTIQAIGFTTGFCIANRSQRIFYPYAQKGSELLLKTSRNFFISRLVFQEISSPTKKQFAAAALATALPFTLKWLEGVAKQRQYNKVADFLSFAEEKADTLTVVATYSFCFFQLIFNPTKTHLLTSLILAGNAISDYGPDLQNVPLIEVFDIQGRMRADVLLTFFQLFLGVLLLPTDPIDFLCFFALILFTCKSVDSAVREVDDIIFRYYLDMSPLRNTYFQRAILNPELTRSLSASYFVSEYPKFKAFLLSTPFWNENVRRRADKILSDLTEAFLQKVADLYERQAFVSLLQKSSNRSCRKLGSFLQNNEMPKSAADLFSVDTTGECFFQRIYVAYSSLETKKDQDYLLSMLPDEGKKCILLWEQLGEGVPIEEQDPDAVQKLLFLFNMALKHRQPIPEDVNDLKWHPFFIYENFAPLTPALLPHQTFRVALSAQIVLKLRKLQDKLKSEEKHVMLDRLDDLIQALEGRSIVQERITTGLVLALEEEPDLENDFHGLGWEVISRFRYCEWRLDPLILSSEKKDQILKGQSIKIDCNPYHLRSMSVDATVPECPIADFTVLIRFVDTIDWTNHRSVLMAKAGGGRSTEGKFARSESEAIEYLKGGLKALITKVQDPKKDSYRVHGRPIEVDAQKIQYQLSHIINKFDHLQEIEQVDLICQLACEGGWECNQGVSSIIHRIYGMQFHEDAQDVNEDFMTQVHRYLHKKRKEIFWKKIQEVRAFIFELDPSGFATEKLATIDVHERNAFLQLFSKWAIEDFDKQDNAATPLAKVFARIPDFITNVNDYMEQHYLSKVPEFLQEGLSDDEPTEQKPLSRELFEAWLQNQGLQWKDIVKRTYVDTKGGGRKEITEEEFSDLSIERGKTEYPILTLTVEEKVNQRIFVLLALSMRAYQERYSIHLL